MHSSVITRTLSVCFLFSLNACVSEQIIVPLPKAPPSATIPSADARPNKVAVSLLPRGEKHTAELCWHPGGGIILYQPIVDLDHLADITRQTLEAHLRARGISIDSAAEKHIALEATDAGCKPKGLTSGFEYMVAIRVQAGNTFSKEFSASAVNRPYGNCGPIINYKNEAEVQEKSEEMNKECMAQAIQETVLKILENRSIQEYLYE
ncbi:MAG: hypothetical protein KKH12_10105 [Gammaproteobacteria bacterium]|nr:hypothetical protein [Gammaproteobacteria bacterium]MBU1482014.1 hypothetical protein [Gammaproteobacteria bacterium]